MRILLSRGSHSGRGANDRGGEAAYNWGAQEDIEQAEENDQELGQEAQRGDRRGRGRSRWWWEEWRCHITVAVGRSVSRRWLWDLVVDFEFTACQSWDNMLWSAKQYRQIFTPPLVFHSDFSLVCREYLRFKLSILSLFHVFWSPPWSPPTTQYSISIPSDELRQIFNTSPIVLWRQKTWNNARFHENSNFPFTKWNPLSCITLWDKWVPYKRFVLYAQVGKNAEYRCRCLPTLRPKKLR